MENHYYKQGLTLPTKRRKEKPIVVDDELEIVDLHSKNQRKCSLNCTETARKFYSLYYTNDDYKMIKIICTLVNLFDHPIRIY